MTFEHPWVLLLLLIPAAWAAWNGALLRTEWECC